MVSTVAWLPSSMVSGSSSTTGAAGTWLRTLGPFGAVRRGRCRVREWRARPSRLMPTVFPALLPTYNRTDVAFVRGEGSYLFAEDGKRYLDLGAGIAVNAFGHANPRLVGALTKQAQTLWHTSNLYRVPG